jgi:hypothetical protein
VHRAALENINKMTAMLRRLCAESGAREADDLAHRLELLIEGALVMRLLKGDDHAACSARAAAVALLESHGVGEARSDRDPS